MSEEMKFGMDNEMEKSEKFVEFAEEATKKQPFTTWTVDGETYKLVLETGVICQLEAKFKKNLMLVLDDPAGLPPLGTMLTIVQGAMNKYHHGMSFYKVQKLFDKYIRTGKTQTEFLSEVVVPIYEVSGFFTEEMSEIMDSESTAEI